MTTDEPIERWQGKLDGAIKTMRTVLGNDPIAVERVGTIARMTHMLPPGDSRAELDRLVSLLKRAEEELGQVLAADLAERLAERTAAPDKL